MTGRIFELARRLRLAGHQQAGTNSDAALLERFVANADSTAFGELVARHGPMVLGVCRRVLSDSYAAEDAFQATFLALAKHAKSVRHPSAIASWLHGVARRAALRLRGTAARHEVCSLAHDPPAPGLIDPLAGVSARELLNALDEELQRLPERYRLAVVHCYLEGRTVDEAAARMATTPGAVRGWLARARDRLANQLAARGFSLPAVLLALTVETVAEAPAVAADAARVPAVVAAAEAAVAVGVGRRMLWAAVACVGVAVGFATAGLVLTPAGPPVVAPGAIAAEPKPASKTDPAEILPAGAVARLGTIQFKLSTDPVSVLYSPDGKRLAIGDGRGSVHVFDAQTGRVTRTFRAAEQDDVWIDAVPLYSPVGDLLAVVTSGGRVGVWDAEKGDTPRWKLPAEDTDVRHLAFSPDGKLLAGGEAGEGRRVRLWDTATGKEQSTLHAHPQSVTGLAFVSEGKQLATSCEDGGVRLFDLATGKQLRLIENAGLKATAVVYSPNGKTLAWALTGSRGDKPVNELVLWDMEAEKEIARAALAERVVGVLAFTPDSRQVLGADANGTHVWDARTGKEERFLNGVGVGKYPTLSVSRDSKTLATPWMKEIVFHDLATGKRRDPAPGPQRRLAALAYAPDGKTLATGGEDGRVYLYDPVTGVLRRELPSDGQGVKGIAFAPDGKTLAVTSGLSEFVWIWDTSSGELVRKLSQPDKDGVFASAVAYSRDGKMLAVTNYGIVRLFDPATGKQIRRFTKPGAEKVNAVAFSPDGTVLATAGADRTLRLWDTATGEQVAIWYHRREFTSVAFAPDGKRLVWGGPDGWCQVCEVPSGRILTRIRGHESGVVSVAFTPDGKRVVTAGAFDNGPRVWDADTGKELLGFRGHLDNPTAVAVAPDGKTAASAGGDAQVLVWDLATARPGTSPIGLPPVRPAIDRVPDGAVRLGPPGSAGGQVAFSPDGKRIAWSVHVPGSEAGVAVWDATTHKQVWKTERDRDEVSKLSWSADGKTVIAACYSDGAAALVLFDAETGKERQRIRELPVVTEHALSPDGKTVAVRHPAISTAEGKRFGGEIDLIDVVTGKQVRRLEGHDGDALAWSPDGKLLASGSIDSSPRDTIRLWDPATGEVVREWDTGLGGVRMLIFLPDGTLASGGEQGVLKLWDTATGKQLRKTDARIGFVLAISADGTRFVVHQYDTPVFVHDVRTGQKLGTYKAGPPWFGFALSPDGKTLATTGNGNLLLWPVPLRDNG